MNKKILSIFFLLVNTAAFSDSFTGKKNGSLKRKDVQEISIAEYAKFIGKNSDAVLCSFFKETKSEWIFICQSKNDIPHVGYQSIIITQKKDGSTELMPGE